MDKYYATITATVTKGVAKSISNHIHKICKTYNIELKSFKLKSGWFFYDKITIEVLGYKDDIMELQRVLREDD